MRLSDLVRRDGWKELAACRTDDGSLNEAFFTQSEAAARDLNKRFCHPCPVAEECTQYAIRFRSEYGIWGGELGEEVMRRHRRRMIDTALESR